MRILGIDPGGKTGYCLIERRPLDLIDRGVIEEADFNSWLKTWPDLNLGIVACEDFIMRPQTGDGLWTPLPTAKKVGACGWRAFDLGITYVELQPSAKPEGYKAAGLRYVKGKKGTHAEDASAHAFYVAVHGFTAKQKRW